MDVHGPNKTDEIRQSGNRAMLQILKFSFGSICPDVSLLLTATNDQLETFHWKNQLNSLSLSENVTIVVPKGH